VYPFGLAEARQRHHLDMRVQPLDRRGGSDAAEAGHQQVHDHDVGQVVAGREHGQLVQRGLAVGGLAEHVDVVEHVEERAHAATDNRVIVDKEDPDPLGVARLRHDHLHRARQLCR